MSPPAPAMKLDRAAWDRAIRTYDRRVFLAVLALGVRVDRARDVVQTTWARLMEKESRGEISRDDLPALALAQARFLALDELRRVAEERRRAGPRDVEAGALLQDDLDAERLLLSKEQLGRATLALAACSPSAQRLFRLLYAERAVPYSQAAAELGLSLQRVRQIMCEV